MRGLCGHIRYLGDGDFDWVNVAPGEGVVLLHHGGHGDVEVRFRHNGEVVLMVPVDDLVVVDDADWERELRLTDQQCALVS